ncbi:MAG: caspase family protein [Armatimonadota bacterium]
MYPGIQSRGWRRVLPLALLALCGGAYASDSYEPDNSAVNARPIATDGSPQAHEINPAADVDFVRFTASAGDECVIETSAPPVGRVRDTVLTLFAPDGVTTLAEDDDGGENLFSRIEHRFATSGSYYARVRSYNASYTGGYLVSVRISRPATIAGTVTRAGEAAEGVAIWARSVTGGLDRPAAVTTTGPDGSYVLDLEAGTYAVSAHLAGTVASPAERVVTAPGGAAADFTLSTAPVSADGVQTFRAVLVGIADYAGSGNDLTWCDDDALEFASALAGGGNWRAENITVLLNQDARRDAIWSALQRMATLSDADDLCLFFFSGHGTRGPDLPPLDETDGQDEYLVEAEMEANIRDDELGEWVAALPTAKFVGVIASCYSGGMIKSASTPAKGLGTIEAAGVADGFAEDLHRAVGRRAREMSPLDLHDNGVGVIITAADDDETCWEAEELRHDVFVYYLLEGMAGVADEDGDGWISVEEAFAYARPRATAYNRGQHAQIYDARPAAPLNFLNVTPARGRSVTITDGPSATPTAVGPGDAVRCSVTAGGEAGGTLTYAWQAYDRSGAAVGGFDDATARQPTWTAPSDASGAYTLLVRVASTVDEDHSESGVVEVRVTSRLTHRFEPGVRMIAIPGSVPEAALGRSTGAAAVKYWDAEAQNYVDTDPPADAGVGCWARFGAPGDAVVACDEWPGDTFAWDLQPGWNIVALPWNDRVDLSTMTAAPAGAVAPLAWTYQDGRYDVVSGQGAPGVEEVSLRPWRSYWVHARERCSATISRGPATASRAQHAGWAIRVLARAESGTDAATVCGVGTSAMTVPDVPAVEGAPDLSLERESEMLAVDLRPGGAREYQWPLQVSAAAGQEVTVHCPDLSAVPAEFSVLLEDRDTGAATSLRTSPGYRYTAGATPRRLMLRVERADASAAFTAVTAQRTHAGASICFSLSTPGRISAEVLNIAGRSVRTLLDQRPHAAGAHVLAWNLRSSSGSAVPAGRYLVRLTARSDDGSIASAVAPLNISG